MSDDWGGKTVREKELEVEIEHLRDEVAKSVEIERKLLEDNRRTEEIIAERDRRIEELERTLRYIRNHMLDLWSLATKALMEDDDE